MFLVLKKVALCMLISIPIFFLFFYFFYNRAASVSILICAEITPSRLNHSSQWQKQTKEGEK